MKNEIINTAEDIAWQLEESVQAMQTLKEILWEESYLKENDKDERLKAYCFIRRFPMYFAVYSVILRDLWNQSDMLGKAIDEHYEKKGKRKQAGLDDEHSH